jgi:phosphopantothenoylcysteine decarboxylase/phosphopantothenate--cysteine ligase
MLKCQLINQTRRKTMKLLENKKILVAVSGSIAVYKTIELIRLYVKAGGSVKVIMTNSATKFISKLTFETISQNSVLDDTNEDWSLDTINNHIAIGKWADIFVIAPATANTINKLSNGIADNILLQTALAYPHTKLLAAAANTNMMANPLTKASLKMLKLCNFKLINTVTKELACKDIGDGAMADIQDIFNRTVRELLKDDYWSDRKIVLNGGGSIEKIDDVRFISNFSSGKMAVSIATALYYKGADIFFVQTPSCETTNISDIYELKTDTTNEMLNFIVDAIRIAKKGKLSDATLMDNSTPQLIQKKPYFFALSAISDYTPMFPQNGKLKKEDIGDNWDLKLKQNIDILKSIDKSDIYTIGFKAEIDKNNALNNASNMLKNKNLDAVCLNILDKNSFGSSQNELEVITKLSNTKLPLDDKLFLALNLLDTLSEQFDD